MTENVQDNQEQIQTQRVDTTQQNIKNLKSMYERQINEQMKRNEELEKQLQEREVKNDDEDDYSEPYVDHKRLTKTMAKERQSIEKITKNQIESAVKVALEEERRNNWLRNNPDFYDVLEKHADKIIAKDPELAEAILSMPATFEREKLVYKNIKTFGLDKPEVRQPDIQDKINRNARHPGYQPTSVAGPGYTTSGDMTRDQWEQSGQKKIKELRDNLRLG